MSGYFLDSSAVGKLYHGEVGSGVVEELVDQADSEAYISRLTVVEIQSVFAGKVRTGEISVDDVEAVRSRFLADLKSRKLKVAAIPHAYFQGAELLIRQYGISLSLRTLDALQLTAALDLHSRGLIQKFVASDRILCNVAVAVGLRVLNPEQP